MVKRTLAAKKKTPKKLLRIKSSRVDSARAKPKAQTKVSVPRNKKIVRENLAGKPSTAGDLNTRLAFLEQELNQRTDELAILNSMGEAMSKTLGVKTVTKIVGDKVRDIFSAEGVSIMLLNTQTNMIHSLYKYDKGEGGYVDYIEPFPLQGIDYQSHSISPAAAFRNAEGQTANGACLAPEALEKSSGVIPESMMMVPIVVTRTSLAW